MVLLTIPRQTVLLGDIIHIKRQHSHVEGTCGGLAHAHSSPAPSAPPWRDWHQVLRRYRRENTCKTKSRQ
jgi:hypothetical protein